MTKKGITGWLGVMLLAVMIGGPAALAGRFAKNHPRRAEVNRRERNQQRRIDRKVANGQLSAQQAKQIESNEAGVKAQERAEVKANGGYLTKPQQRQLNRELNQDSRAIHNQ
jgi:hypothetical protein